MTIKHELKALLTAKKAEIKAEEELRAIYELGQQTAHRGLSIDDMPHYRKQNKAAAWLKGFADAEQELKAKALQRNAIDKEGIAKLKQLVKEKLTEK